MKKIMFVLVVSVLSSATHASTLLNSMQGCQAVIAFINDKLDNAPAAYAVADVSVIKQGLNSYDAFIQSNVMDPGLLKFNNGDKQKAQAMQLQVDEYKKQIQGTYAKSYQHNRMLTDYAMTMNNCAKKAAPKGDELDALKKSLETIIKLARQPS